MRNNRKSDPDPGAIKPSDTVELSYSELRNLRHDLLNQLNVINGATELVRKAATTSNQDLQARGLGRISRASAELQRCIDAALASWSQEGVENQATTGEPIKAADTVDIGSSAEPAAIQAEDGGCTIDEVLLDSRDGLQRLAGDIATYHRLLIKFSENHRETHKQLLERVEKRDRVAAINIILSLKGAAGNLGLKAVFRQAGLLETSLAENDFPGLEQGSQQLGLILNTSIEEIDSLVRDQSS